MIVGVVGIGYWGSKVVEEYVALRDQGVIDAVAACDSDPERLSHLPAVDKSFTSLNSLLNYVDAIHICSPNHTHVDIAERAMKVGRDVLVEKPLTPDRRSAYDLVELASEQGRILKTGHIFRFASVIRRVRDLYQDDYFGTIYDISLQWTHWMEPHTSTNVIWDLMPHPVDISNFITGVWPDKPIGRTSSQRTDVVESAKVQMAIDGADLFIKTSWNDRIRRRTLDISGSERSAHIECVDQNITVHGDDQAVESIDVDDNNTIRAEVENFVESIRTGKNTFNSAIIGARTVDTISQIEESIIDG